jgi:DNA-binding beta-propeller fold protein YncE
MTGSVKQLALGLVAAASLGCVAPLQAQMASQMPSSKAQGAVAIATLPSGALAVLGGRGRLSLIDPSSGRVTVLKDTLGYFSPADMAAGRVGDTDSIFVTLYGAVERQGVLARYSASGEQVKTWNARAVFAGIAVDSVHQIVYLGDAVTGEISSMSESSSSPSFVVEVPGVNRLGPLAVDAAGQRLFAADVGTGTVSVVDLARRRSHLLVSGIGEPAALAYDSNQQRLYVADAARRCIWQVATNSAVPKAVTFSSASQLREPRGVTLDAQHAVWVADHAAMAVFKLSAQGQVVLSVSP